MTCCFTPPIIIEFESCKTTKQIYRDWLTQLLTSFELFSKEELQQKSFEFYKHLLRISTVDRDIIWLKIDSLILKYFHNKGELLFKHDVNTVKKSHQNRYMLEISTKFGYIRQRFSSIRECRQVTGLDFRKQLRRILY